MPEDRTVIINAPELKNKDFWSKVPKVAYPSDLLDLIGYYDSPRPALVKERNGAVIQMEIGKNNKQDIIIAYPDSKAEQKKFDEFDKFLREIQMALEKISQMDNPEEMENWTRMILDKEVILYGEISNFFDSLRMRALKMALNEFNTTYSKEKTMIMERIREANSND